MIVLSMHRYRDTVYVNLSGYYGEVFTWVNLRKEPRILMWDHR